MSQAPGAGSFGLLIVPYGIETWRFLPGAAPRIRLLIVPYGIETPTISASFIVRSLLIVPYGIET